MADVTLVPMEDENKNDFMQRCTTIMNLLGEEDETAVQMCEIIWNEEGMMENDCDCDCEEEVISLINWLNS